MPQSQLQIQSDLASHQMNSDVFLASTEEALVWLEAQINQDIVTLQIQELGQREAEVRGTQFPQHLGLKQDLSCPVIPKNLDDK